MTVPEFQKNEDACLGILELMKTLDPKNTTHWNKKTLSCSLDLAPLIKDPWTMVNLLRNAAKVLEKQEHWVLIPEYDPLGQTLPHVAAVSPGKYDTGKLLHYLADMME